MITTTFSFSLPALFRNDSNDIGEYESAIVIIISKKGINPKN
jgi:hypothetical protein